jgi:deglycase
VLVLPGGYINPDLLRRRPEAVRFTRSFFEARKPVGVICHGPWTLIEADVLAGRTLSSVESLRTDICNAGGRWVDADVHVDAGAGSTLVSGRDHQAVHPFAETLVRELEAHSPPGERREAGASESPPMDPDTSEADRRQLALARGQGDA